MAIERSQYVPAELEEWHKVIEQVNKTDTLRPKKIVAIDLINEKEFTFEDEASFVLGYN